MAGFVEELVNRDEALERVTDALSFPWALNEETLPLEKAVGRRLARDLFSASPFPAFTRSLRDGYAVASIDVVGAAPSAPLFLEKGEEVPMGREPGFKHRPQRASLIHTGGILPPGADAVVMLEDSEEAGGLVEVRRSVQAGENVMPRGEEISEGAIIAARGDLLGHRSIGFLAALGIVQVPCLKLTVGIISTGDEVVEADRADLPPGCVRDVNSWSLFSLLLREGFSPIRLGIIGDEEHRLTRAIEEGQRCCDVVLISGGSSVSLRDHVAQILASVPSPGLIVRGLNLSPGKPTLLAGSLNPRKLLLGLPGHPLSCSVVAITVLKPLLLRLIGSPEQDPIETLPVGADVYGRAGIEEFLPAFSVVEEAFPLAAKSGFVGALRTATHLIRLPLTEETVRKGEKVTLWRL